jgi:hypothetical protein
MSSNSDFDDDERIYSVAAGKNKMTPYDRIKAGVISHQAFILPLVFVSAIGVVQIVVPWWIVWPVLAAAGFYYFKTREVKLKATAEKHERSQAQLEEELLADENATEKQKAAAKAARLEKERQIAARIEAELLAHEAPVSRGADSKKGKGKNASSAKKPSAAISSSAQDQADDDDDAEEAYFMSQLVARSKKGLQIAMKDVIAASEPSAGEKKGSAPPSRKGAVETEEAEQPAAGPSSSGRRRQNRAKSDGSWQQS